MLDFGIEQRSLAMPSSLVVRCMLALCGQALLTHGEIKYNLSITFTIEDLQKQKITYAKNIVESGRKKKMKKKEEIKKKK